MDYEEKYKTALERAKEIYTGSYKPEVALTIAETFIKVFPELKESEDEKIRKELINYFTEGREFLSLCSFGKDEIITWLEKQGIKPQGKSALEAIKEEKVDNANKIKPKFKNGQWIVWQDKFYKVNFNGCGYELIDQNGLSTSLEYGTVEQSARLWYIKDAKDGDILYSPNLKLLWIFKSRDTVYCGCNLNYNDGAICGEGYFERPTDAIPATKEQCDLFFQKMKEAGCRWNSTEKKLEKIDSGKESESKKEEKSYNTEECNCIIQDTISICEQARKNATNEIDYENTTRCIGWLKILKYRHTWKPSKEQMDTLLFISSVLQDKQVIVNLEELKTLYNDLKKL